VKIGIIGAGHIGSTLAKRFTDAGHAVTIANSRGPDSLRDVAEKTGARPVTVVEAARGNDVVVVTIPEPKVSDLPKNLFDGVPESVVVVDTGNYYPRQRDGRIAGIEDGNIPESRWVEQQLGRPVVKAFNNIYAQHLAEKGKPQGTPGRVALPISGDDPRAKKVVAGLIEAIGFDVVDNGTIEESWRQQPGSPVYTKDYDRDGVRNALSEARRERTPQWTATAESPGTYDSPK
jgi:predicted dinucleotide-binding enzyme